MQINYRKEGIFFVFHSFIIKFNIANVNFPSYLILKHVIKISFTLAKQNFLENIYAAVNKFRHLTFK